MMTPTPDPIGKLREGFDGSGHLSRDVPAFLTQHGCPKTAVHCADVAAEARRVAAHVGTDPDRAEAAGWLHDVSAVFPARERVIVARELGIEVLPAEEAFPMIVHQKLSVVLACEIFNVNDQAVLSAIGCHTTLKAGASVLDKAVFIADKIAWDQPGVAPYQEELLRALEQSLDHAVRFYLGYLWERRAELKVVHPWLRAACQELLPASSQ